MPSMQEAVTCLSFGDDSTGYAFTFNQNIYKTTDGGVNWKLLRVMNGMESLYYSAVVVGKAVYFGAGNTIFKTNDDFKNYNRIYKSLISPGDNDFVKAIKISRNNLFFLTYRQSIIKIKFNN
jgi:photosystem II stability/assembly factor-like uncharacterized protein